MAFKVVIYRRRRCHRHFNNRNTSIHRSFGSSLSWLLLLLGEKEGHSVHELKVSFLLQRRIVVGHFEFAAVSLQLVLLGAPRRKIVCGVIASVQIAKK